MPDEPQTVYLKPAEGGSYVQNPDGSLTRVIEPTTVPDFAPVEQPAQE